MSSAVVMQLIVLFGVLFLLMALKFPIFLCMIGSVVAYAIIWPGSIPIYVFAQGIIKGLSNQNFVAVCFYFFLGEIMTDGGLGDRLVDFLQSVIGHVRGSLSHVNILASVVFAGVSGSSVADTASISGMIMNTQIKAGYPREHAAAITEVSSLVGPIIPPSTGFVLLGVYFSCSIRRLYIAGIVPGLIMGLMMVVITIIVSRKQNFPRQDWRGWRHVGKMAKRGLPAFLLPALIMIFLFLGIGTIVEVGATSCLIAIILASLYGEMTPKKLLKMLMHTSIMAATCYAMVGFSGLYTWIITSMGVAKWIAAQILAAGASKLAVCSVAMLILFILGMILDTLVLQMVIIPVMVPMLLAVGIDPIWFCVVALIVIQLGLITPPVGTLIYLTAKMAGCSSMGVVKASAPYMIGMVLIVLLLLACPAVVTFLPTIVMG